MLPKEKFDRINSKLVEGHWVSFEKCSDFHMIQGQNFGLHHLKVMFVLMLTGYAYSWFDQIKGNLKPLQT